MSSSKMYFCAIIPFIYGVLAWRTYVVMENRRRVKFGWLLLIHNATMILTYMCICGMVYMVMDDMSKDEYVSGDEFSKSMIYLYTFARFREIFDTFAILLRKRNKQLGAYHVIRRGSSCFSGLLLATLSMQTLLICGIDSIVQIIVYFYYSFCSIGLGFLLKRYKSCLNIFALASYVACLAICSQM
jgi:uncharacterized protein YacL